MSNRPGLFEELRRRKVVRTVLVYLAAVFATVEAADVVFPVLGLPAWALNVLVWLAAIGLPIVIVLGWLFELTPEGLRPERDETAGPASQFAWLSPRTIGLVSVILAIGVGVGWLARSASRTVSTEPDEKSIAVIPFDNLSNAEENAFFAVGIQDEILTQLQKISELRVISRSSTMRYEPGPARPSIQAMGEQLDARWIVEGSAARVGDEVRLNVQLSESRSGAQLWAEAYDADLTVQGILAFQSQIARRVAESLEATIQPQEEVRISAVPTESTEAYELYLQGIDHFSGRGEAGLRRSLDAFDQALAIDPSYALAYAGQAMTYAVLPFYSDTPTRESATLGLAAAYRALAIDSAVAEAHAALGDLLIHAQYDLPAAEGALRRAIELSPSNAQAHSWLTEALLADGRIEEGVAAGNRSIELDPLSAVISLNFGRSLLEAGETQAAISELERAEALDPAFPSTLEALGAAYVEATEYEKATQVYRRYAELVGGEASSLAAFASALEASSQRQASDALDSIEEVSWRMPAYSIARAYMQLGESEKAVHWLERARQRGDPLLPFASNSAIFAPIRDDLAFVALISDLK